MMKRILYRLSVPVVILLTLITSFSIAHSRNDVVVVGMIRTYSGATSYNNIPETPVIIKRDIDSPQSNVINQSSIIAIASLRGGGYLIPAGWNPLGYKITVMGEQFLSLGGSLECDVGRFIASLKSSRKSRSTIKESWLEIVRASKTGQVMRIYRSIDELLDFCLKTGLID